VFNLADIFITLGAGILILSLLLSGKAENQWP
jgi:lipoprotein signal peptidase